MSDLTTLANVKQWLGLTGLAIASISKANPAVVTLQTRPATPLLTGQAYQIDGITGMTQLPAGQYTVTVIDPTSFSIPIDSTLFSTYTGGATLGITDPLLARLITAVSTTLQSMLNRNLLSANYIETRNGQGMAFMLLQQYPITAVQSVTVDGVAIPARPALTASVSTGNRGGFVADANQLMLSGYLFTRGFQNVTVQYTAGFATVPYDVEQAVIDTIGDWFRYIDRIGKTSQAIEGQTTAFVNAALPVRAREVLNQYAKRAPIGP